MLREMKGLEESHTTNPQQPPVLTGRDIQTQRQEGRLMGVEPLEDQDQKESKSQKNLPPLSPCGMRPIYINNEVHTRIRLP